MLQPPSDVVLEDYMLIGEEYAKWMAQYSRASMKYYAENRHTMMADIQLQGARFARFLSGGCVLFCITVNMLLSRETHKQATCCIVVGMLLWSLTK
jgi:hypothetical protein